MLEFQSFLSSWAARGRWMEPGMSLRRGEGVDGTGLADG